MGHPVYIFDSIHQLSSCAHIVPALWLWVYQLEAAVLSKCNLKAKRKTVAHSFTFKFTFLHWIMISSDESQVWTLSWLATLISLPGMYLLLSVIFWLCKVMEARLTSCQRLDAALCALNMINVIDADDSLGWLDCVSWHIFSEWQSYSID